MTELLPCPFCGGEAQTLRNGSWWCVACRTPFCCDVGKFDTEAEAIAAWNTRAERTCERVHADGWLWTCSACGSMYDSGNLYNYCPNCGAKVVGE